METSVSDTDSVSLTSKKLLFSRTSRIKCRLLNTIYLGYSDMLCSNLWKYNLRGKNASEVGYGCIREFHFCPVEALILIYEK